MPLELLALFDDREAATRASSQLRHQIPSARPQPATDRDVEIALRLRQQDESDEVLALPPVRLLPGPLARGALIWGAPGLVLGALLGVVVGAVIPVDEDWRALAVIFTTVAGAFAVSAWLGVYGAGRQADVEDVHRPQPTEGDSALRVEVDGRSSAREMRALLVQHGAVQVEVFDLEGPDTEPTGPDAV